MSTTIPSGKDIKRKWFVLDASGKTLGRLATQAASILAGKLNVLYTPYIDMGDHVIIINAEKIVLTGLKSDQKLYRRYTGFPGGLREESFIKLLARRPEAIVEQAVKGMLPKSKLGRQMATKLKVYKGGQHPHLAQQPVFRCDGDIALPRKGGARGLHHFAMTAPPPSAVKSEDYRGYLVVRRGSVDIPKQRPFARCECDIFFHDYVSSACHTLHPRGVIRRRFP